MLANKYALFWLCRCSQVMRGGGHVSWFHLELCALHCKLTPDLVEKQALTCKLIKGTSEFMRKMYPTLII